MMIMKFQNETQTQAAIESNKRAQASSTSSKERKEASFI